MSIRTRRPVRMLGGAHNSGHTYTGHVPIQQGGMEVMTVFSGAILMSNGANGNGVISSGNSVLFASGAGRVSMFTALYPADVALAGNGDQGVLSGHAITLYDSAIMARSGIFTDQTIPESGRKILYTWYPPRLLSGATPAGGGFNPVQLDIPYYSGLCAMAHSGAPGFNVCFTRDFDPADEPRGP